MKRLQFLDSLRGIAALYVGAYHTPIVYDPRFDLLPDWLRPFHAFGASGVTLFFVISAFSLCLTMPRHSASKYPNAHYFTSRFFRIAPLFYFMLFVYYIINVFTFKYYLPPKILLENAALIFNFIPDHQMGFVAASWTIGVEVVFYAVFPILYFAGSTIWRKLALLAASVILFLLGHRILGLVMHDPAHLSQYELFWFPRFFPIFLVGMVAFDVLRYVEESFYHREIGIAFIALGLLGVALSIYDKIPWSALDVTHVYAIAYMFLLLGAALFPWRMIVNRVTAFYGKISYSFYLLHPIVIVCLLAPVHQYVAHSSLPHVLIYVVCVAVTIVAVTPIAILTYYFIEKPGISFGYYLMLRLRLRVHRAALATTG